MLSKFKFKLRNQSSKSVVKPVSLHGPDAKEERQQSGTPRLGEMLIKEGLINEEQLKEALEVQKRSGGHLGYHLVKLGFVGEDDISNTLSKQYGIPTVSFSNIQIKKEVLKLIPVDIVKKHLVLPIEKKGSSIVVAMADPTNSLVLDEIRFLVNCHTDPVVAGEMALRSAITKFYGIDLEGTMSIAQLDFSGGVEDALGDGIAGLEEDLIEGPEAPVVDVDEFDNIVKGAIDDVEVVEEDVEDEAILQQVEAPIVKLVNALLIRAIKLKVSDIHIEPYERSFRVRYRLDGVLTPTMNLPLKIKNAVISRIKIMAKLDIAEKRLPQDGRIKLKFSNKRDVDFRVSVLPTLFGEKVVLRLLDKSNLQLDMTKLGFEPEAQQRFKEALGSPWGMVLVTGPTGSGKTTTLYSALSELNSPANNIMTAEDPVEFNIAGINQVNMRGGIGLNFAAALRSFLRQDPDIIMVGEIRDLETAGIAVKAALTGHLVLSTLHTNDAPSTIGRLLNMGIEPFLVASSVVLIAAQRLARRLCPQCKEEIEVPPSVLKDVGFSDDEIGTFDLYKPVGCPECSGMGYKGRVALYEVMKITDAIRDLILNNKPISEIAQTAIEEGMHTLRHAGLNKVKEGLVPIEEVLRVTVSI